MKITKKKNYIKGRIFLDTTSCRDADASKASKKVDNQAKNKS